MSRLETLEPKYFHLILDMYRPTFRVQHNILLKIPLSQLCYKYLEAFKD